MWPPSVDRRTWWDRSRPVTPRLNPGLTVLNEFLRRLDMARFLRYVRDERVVMCGKLERETYQSKTSIAAEYSSVRCYSHTPNATWYRRLSAVS